MSGCFLLCCFLLFILPQEIDSPPLDSWKLKTILWPVRRGANRISCPPLQKALEQKRSIDYVAWFKCFERSQTGDCLDDWPWLAGINSMGHVDVSKTSKYHLDEKIGFLQIRYVFEADNDTMYRCTVKSCNLTICNRESIYIILRFYPGEDIPVYSSTTKPVTTSGCPTASSVTTTEKPTAKCEKAKVCKGYIVAFVLSVVLNILFGGYSCYRKCNDRRSLNAQNQMELAASH